MQGSVQRHCDSPGSSAASQLAHALQELLPNSRTGLEVHSLRHQVLSAALKAMCVLLLPPHFLHGSGELWRHYISCAADVSVSDGKCVVRKCAEVVAFGLKVQLCACAWLCWLLVSLWRQHAAKAHPQDVYIAYLMET